MAAAAHDEDDDKRWNLQQEIGKIFKISLKRTLGDHTKVVFRISTCTKEDGYDYVCKSKLNIHTKILKKRIFEDLQDVGLAIVKNLPASVSDMMERCIVCGPGYLKFTLSRQWIAKNIHKMLTDGIDTWARKLPMRKAIIDFSSRNVVEEHDFGHLRSAIIVDTLARIIEYSKVEVIRRSHLKDNELRRKRYEKVYELLGIRVEEKSKSSLYDIYIPAILHLLRGKGLIKESGGVR